MTKHSLIFIHGMGTGDPAASYQQLWKSIASQYNQIHHLDAGGFDRLFELVPINYKDITYHAKKDIYESAFPELSSDELTACDILNPVRFLHYFVTFFLGDVTAYVSKNDNHIRSTFWQQSKQAMLNGSYSIIAHSLGSVIAFDFLYNSIECDELFLPNPDKSSANSAIEQSLVHSETTEFQQNQAKIVGNFQNFFTFGSTIGLFMMRQGNLWRKEPTFSDIVNPVIQANGAQNLRSWLNFYDREDILAYPLENLFNRNPQNVDRALKDIAVQTGNLVINSHINYWQNNDMARKIAQTLP